MDALTHYFDLCDAGLRRLPPVLVTLFALPALIALLITMFPFAILGFCMRLKRD